VINGQFLKDIGATSNESLLQYTTGTEVGNIYGNYAGTGDGAFLDESTKFTGPIKIRVYVGSLRQTIPVTTS